LHDYDTLPKSLVVVTIRPIVSTDCLITNELATIFFAQHYCLLDSPWIGRIFHWTPELVHDRQFLYFLWSSWARL